MSRQTAERELNVAEPGVASLLPEAQAIGAKSFPRRLAATHRSKLPIIVWLVLCLIWGSTWLFIKLGLEDLPPISFAGIRFVIAAAILSCVVIVRRIQWPRARRDWLLILVTGLLAFALNYGLLFWGEE